jgi:hypothetical protein
MLVSSPPPLLLPPHVEHVGGGVRSALTLASTRQVATAEPGSSPEDGVAGYDQVQCRLGGAANCRLLVGAHPDAPAAEGGRPQAGLEVVEKRLTSISRTGQGRRGSASLLADPAMRSAPALIAGILLSSLAKRLSVSLARCAMLVRREAEEVGQQPSGATTTVTCPTRQPSAPPRSAAPLLTSTQALGACE